MKKLFRKGAAIILALGMCLTALTGCNSSKEAGEDGALTLFYSDLSGVNTAIKRKSDLYKKYMEPDCRRRSGGHQAAAVF